MIAKIIQKIKQRINIYQNYYEILGKHRKQQQAWDREKPTVVFYWTKLSMYPYQYALMQYFAIAGYNVLLQKNMLWLGGMTDEFQEMLCKIPQLAITNKIYSKLLDTIFITDIEAKKNKKNWKKNIYLDANIFTISPPYFSNNWIMPYPMNPKMYALKSYEKIGEYREKKRIMKLFFSGNQDQNSYTNPIFDTFFQKLNRIEAIQTLLENLPEEQKLLISNNCIEIPQYKNAFVLNQWSWTQKSEVNIQKRVSNQDWLQTLALSDFFLGCTGVNQPLCHNLIEAMSVGTIPVLEYAEYFTPALEHKKNAIIFKGKEDLAQKVKDVLAMPQEEIDVLRKNVVSYYEEYLKPEMFVQNIQKRTDKKQEHLFVFAEAASHVYLKN